MLNHRHHHSSNSSSSDKSNTSATHHHVVHAPSSPQSSPTSFSISSINLNNKNQLVILISILLFIIMLLLNKVGFVQEINLSSLSSTSSSSTSNSDHEEALLAIASSSKRKKQKIFTSPPQNPNLVYGVSTVEFEENVPEHNSSSLSSSFSYICPLKSNTYKDLGQFPFWGKIMNSSFSCPAAGMNNQLTLLLAFWHCHESKQQQQQKSSSSSIAPFRWKDISCSPTGGKDGNRKFVVGSSDYVYAWFRWSEVFDIKFAPRWLSLSSSNSNLISTTSANRWKSTLCLHDSYTWKEHPELAKCNSNIGHLYGSKVWWELRGRLSPKSRFQLFAKCFLNAASTIGGDDSKNDNSNNKNEQVNTVSPAMNPLKKEFLRCVSKISDHHSPEDASEEKEREEHDKTFNNQNDVSNSSKTSSSLLFSNGVLGLHIRRGDYAHFCKGLTGSSGIRKFRVPPYKWLSKNTEQLSSKFPDTCAPSDSKIIDHIKRVITKSHENANNNNNNNNNEQQQPIKTVFIASNSNSLIEKIRLSLSDWNVPNNNNNNKIQVVSLSDVTGTESKKDAEIVHQIWPDELYSEHWRSEKYWRAQRYSLTDKVMLDIIILSLCQIVVLNRYSTFSQSVIDERVLLAAAENGNDGEISDFSLLHGIKNGVKWW